ncbi:lysophospholipid acyltransferase family protein [Ramlibacter tataouinensis]|uniref:Candidate 1-acylglycerol-3-phosphate O-acyltransferase (Lyso-phosphatidic acid acyltransferase) n=1 Tax=Ramlibacter tataouinensis (strain ATCC BAA-407 / DSM 14655 / LMG 21543 / TTB310) TaxID=365046 RepID=F5XZG2_RAMTT|nr:lysophospholipid acyltransferase family protein [Ramlibacter tataouinensis]AEG94519.1 Candidate 1-acylglycerol-3-phosphate O-acyltransferase (lyso-phosphatidic acid acyltransferase) [Ramlibacter tataouinensis TTB310]
MKALGAAWKLLRALAHAVAGLLTIMLRFPRLSPAGRKLEVQRWAGRLLECLDVGLELRGRPPGHGPLLLVSNHISWLDIPVLHAARHCRFVSKADVRHWPLIGRLATGAGTLYIERESRRDALRVVHQMADALRAGDILAVFPEGTTSDGVSLLPFHGNLLQAAIAADAPVQPVALSFIDAATGLPTLAPCYINDDTLLGSVWRTLTGPRITAVVSYGPPQRAQGRDRRAWAGDLREAVGALRRR